MFTSHCLIRKNTPELVDRLEKIGYNCLFSARGNYGKNLLCYWGNCTGDDEEQIGDYKFFDCGINEDLFFAIAALRDDSDCMQWFCGFIITTNQEMWILCKNDKIIDNPWAPNLHKCTIEELANHFKN
jgi:hypothetical protein